MTSAAHARRKPADLLLAAEALALLAFFRICLAALPVHKIIGAITRRCAASSRAEALNNSVPVSPTDRDLAIALRVRWAIEAVARNSPVGFVCFPQTLAGYVMLRRRGVASIMVYGIARSPEDKLIAHTWLMIGDRTVVSGEGSGAFTAVDRWT